MSGSNTRTTVFNRLVCDGELSKVMTNHLRLKRDKIHIISCTLPGLVNYIY